jgi:hypothetical protein
VRPNQCLWRWQFHTFHQQPGLIPWCLQPERPRYLVPAVLARADQLREPWTRPHLMLEREKALGGIRYWSSGLDTVHSSISQCIQYIHLAQPVLVLVIGVAACTVLTSCEPKRTSSVRPCVLCKPVSRTKGMNHKAICSAATYASLRHDKARPTSPLSRAGPTSSLHTSHVKLSPNLPNCDHRSNWRLLRNLDTVQSGIAESGQHRHQPEWQAARFATSAVWRRRPHALL